MTDPNCRGCGGRLVFSARERRNGLCGPCTRAAAPTELEAALLGCLWVAGVLACRRASFRRRLMLVGINTPILVPPMDLDLKELEIFLGSPPTGLIPTGFGLTPL